MAMNAIDVRSVEKDQLPDPAAYRQSEMEPGRDAWDLVKQVWMTEGPGRIMLPVDPVAISRRLGIEVFADDEMPPEVAGVIRKEAEYKNPEIVLNETDPYERRRFTCAHFLGRHCRNEEIGKEGVWEITKRRDFLAVPIGDTEEVYATEFAAEMLMPRAVFREIRDSRSVTAFAAMFVVTADVMRFRLDQIGWNR
jgi:hypothetical protein